MNFLHRLEEYVDEGECKPCDEICGIIEAQHCQVKCPSWFTVYLYQVFLSVTTHYLGTVFNNSALGICYVLLMSCKYKAISYKMSLRVRATSLQE